MRRLGLIAASLLLGCYDPSPADKGFRCTGDNNYMCPEGQSCDRAAGFCVTHLPDLGLVPADLGFSVDQSVPPGPRSCDQRVQQGALSGLVALGPLNTAADETSISVSADGATLFYQSGGVPMTAHLSGKTASNPTAFNIAGAPAAIRGGSVNADGSWWFSGDDGAGGATSLFQAKGTLPNLTATAQVFPTTATQQTVCPFTDPVFRDGVASNDLYLSYPLGGCGTSPYIAEGLNNKQLGAFVSALPASGFRSPSLISGGLTLLFSSVAPQQRRLYFATRPTTDSSVGDADWVGPFLMPLGTLGVPSGGDWQAVVSPDCSTLYLSSVRAGSVSGSADLYAADISPQ